MGAQLLDFITIHIALTKDYGLSPVRAAEGNFLAATILLHAGFGGLLWAKVFVISIVSTVFLLKPWGIYILFAAVIVGFVGTISNLAAMSVFELGW